MQNCAVYIVCWSELEGEREEERERERERQRGEYAQGFLWVLKTPERSRDTDENLFEDDISGRI